MTRVFVFFALLLCVPAFAQDDVQGEPPAQPTQPTQQAPGQAAQTTFLGLLTAIGNADYEGFTQNGDDAFRAAMTPEAFEQVVQAVAPRLGGGFETTYFGSLRQQGFTAHLWRVRFADGTDDLLASLSLQNDQVGGFFLR